MGLYTEHSHHTTLNGIDFETTLTFKEGSLYRVHIGVNHNIAHNDFDAMQFAVWDKGKYVRLDEYLEAEAMNDYNGGM